MDVLELRVQPPPDGPKVLLAGAEIVLKTGAARHTFSDSRWRELLEKSFPGCKLQSYAVSFSQ
jgi:hypothetical protein